MKQIDIINQKLKEEKVNAQKQIDQIQNDTNSKIQQAQQQN